MKKQPFILGALLLFSTTVIHAADMTLEVIPLQHRLVDDIVPVLQPLVAPGGSVTGMNNQLIIKTTPDNLAELKSVLQSLDRSPRRLLISVRQDVSGNQLSRDQAIDGRYSSGDAGVSIDSARHRRDGLVISAGDDEGNVIRYRNSQTENSSDDRNTFKVQATEGYPAFITTGQSVPVKTRSTYATRHGVVVNDGTEYIEAQSGFYVLPRINGNQVTLLVAPELTRVTPGRAPVFDTQNVETTATGQLGEWIELGGINQSSATDNSGLLSSSGRQSTTTRTVLIRVDEIK